MGAVLYYMLTFAESAASVFGVRFPYEQPRYAIVQTVGEDVEVRRYEPRVAVEATVDARRASDAPGQAFRSLFDYIAGANQRRQKIAMTVPARLDGRPERIAMTIPVQSGPARSGRGGDEFSMRFFLPADVVRSGAPRPNDPNLHLVESPAETIAALRYSGVPTADARRRRAATLLRVLAASGWQPQGDVFQLSYDPPFAIPFLRRNEVAVVVGRKAG